MCMADEAKGLVTQLDELRSRRQAGDASAQIIRLPAGTHRIERPLVLDAQWVGEGLTIQGHSDPTNPKTSPDERTVITSSVGMESRRDGDRLRYKIPREIERTIRSILIDGKEVPSARWPREDFFRIQGAYEDRRTGVYLAEASSELTVEPEKFPCELVLLHDWSSSRIPIASYGRDRRLLRTRGPLGCIADHYAIDHFEKQPRFYLQGDRSFATEHGDWFHDLASRELVLIWDESAAEPTIELATCSVLIRTSGEERIRDLTLRNLVFRGTHLDVPPGGFASAQATAIEVRRDDGSRPSGSRDMLSAAVQLDRTDRCRVERCRFTDLGGTALWLGRTTRDAIVANNRIDHVGGNGVNLGEDNDRKVDGQRWHQSGADEVSTNNRIVGNEISHVGRWLPGSVAIWVPLSRNVTIDNNHIHDCPYTGISLGWMWNPSSTPAAANTVTNNRIEFVMQTLSDGAGIYTLGNQPQSTIRGNRINDVPLNLGRAESNGIFCDEGSQGFAITENVIRRIGKSPVRFHRAGQNSVTNNGWELVSDPTPPVRYINTPEANIRVEGNEILAAQKSLFLIGNSLTWDTVPSKLDGNVHWHVDCGKSLIHIRHHPERPCVPTSRLWPDAFQTQEFDFISFQPHYGTTLDEDVDTISDWMATQPTAIVIIHTGWARDADLPSEWQSDGNDRRMIHSPAYFDALTRELQSRFPNRKFRSTGAMNVLWSIEQDIRRGEAPFQDRSELYRDAIHMTTTAGRFLMHNLMRQMLGQPIREDWDGVSSEQKAYLISKLAEHDSEKG